MWHYRIAGLRVACQIPLPGLRPSACPGSAADVIIRRAAVPPDLRSATSRGPDWAMAEGGFLLVIAGVSRILISDGCEIAFDLEANADEREAALFLLGSAFGILLQQRGHLVLHASAVAVHGRAVLFCGPSGAGKSTLAAALARADYPFVSDDVCRVAFDREDRPTIESDGRMLKLWADAVEHLALGHAKGEAVHSRFDKYYVPPPLSAEPSALPLAAVYFLRESSRPLERGIDTVNIADAAALLSANAYRPHLVEPMGLVKNYFFDAAKVWRHARFFFLTRPRDFADMPRLVCDLDAHWRALDLLPRPHAGRP